MLRISDIAASDSHAFLVAFCKLAWDLYPNEDWSQAEPKLERSWMRYVGDLDRLHDWSYVREEARAHWHAGSHCSTRPSRHGVIALNVGSTLPSSGGILQHPLCRAGVLYPSAKTGVCVLGRIY